MTAIRHTLVLIAASFLLCAFVVRDFETARASSKPLVVIVSAATPLHDISTAQLRSAFLGNPTEYAPGKRLIPINHPLNTPPRVSFDRSVLKLKASEVGPFWVDRRIRDQSGPPKTAPSADLAVRLAMSLNGAISYAYTDQLNDKVRALTIDGKAPAAADYLLAE
jgi:hypothetical protein